MNHDYAHCLDYDPHICPKGCFRAMLVVDLKHHPGLPVSWMHLKDTGECVLAQKRETNGDRIRGMSNRELAEFLQPLTDCVRCYAWDKDGEYDMRPCYTGEKPCKKMWLEWLKQEVKPNGKT